jgi:hypothetical protein
VTEIDAGHEPPEALRRLGGFHAIFQGENKKMHLALSPREQEVNSLALLVICE